MFEKEAEEYMHKDGTESEKLLNTIDLSLTKRQAFVLINICKQCFKDGAEFGYEQGIARLRYCCTCKHYMGRCYDGTEPYGICADWEIKEND